MPQVVGAAMGMGQPLALHQGLDVGRILDLRAAVVAVRVGGQFGGSVEDAHAMLVGDDTQGAPDMGVRDREERRRHTRESAAPRPGMAAALPLPLWKEFQPQRAQVRAQGLSRSVGEVLPGINAMAAPVFDLTGDMVMAITAIGPAEVFETAWHGALAGALRDCAREVTRRLGGSPPPAPARVGA